MSLETVSTACILSRRVLKILTRDHDAKGARRQIEADSQHLWQNSDTDCAASIPVTWSSVVTGGRSGQVRAVFRRLEAALPVHPRPFPDPGWSEAWWWLALPLVFGIGPVVAYLNARGFYDAWLGTEQGAIEIGHTIMPAIACVLAVILMTDRRVRASRPLMIWLGVAAFGSFYMAGEEASWGQQFFHWGTPELWQEVNDQAETNLHNTTALLDQVPRAVLRLGVFLGGLVLPLLFACFPKLWKRPSALLVPPAALIPAAIGAIFFQWIDQFLSIQIVGRTSEMEETFLMLFVLFYVIVLRRRVRQLDVAGSRA